MYLLALADETAGPNWLRFFEGTNGYPECNKGKKFLIFFVSKIEVKNLILFFKIPFFFISRASL